MLRSRAFVTRPSELGVKGSWVRIPPPRPSEGQSLGNRSSGVALSGLMGVAEADAVLVGLPLGPFRPYTQRVDQQLDDEPLTQEDLDAIAESRAEFERGEFSTLEDVKRRLLGDSLKPTG